MLKHFYCTCLDAYFFSYIGGISDITGWCLCTGVEREERETSSVAKRRVGVSGIWKGDDPFFSQNSRRDLYTLMEYMSFENNPNQGVFRGL